VATQAQLEPSVELRIEQELTFIGDHLKILERLFWGIQARLDESKRAAVRSGVASIAKWPEPASDEVGPEQIGPSFSRPTKKPARRAYATILSLPPVRQMRG